MKSLGAFAVMAMSALAFPVEGVGSGMTLPRYKPFGAPPGNGVGKHKATKSRKCKRKAQKAARRKNR